MYDKDGSGTIELSEMVEVLETVYIMEGVTSGNMAKIRAKEIFKELDRDGDGTLTCEEFIEGCMKDTEMMAMLKKEDDEVAKEDNVEENSVGEKPKNSKKGSGKKRESKKK